MAVTFAKSITKFATFQ